MFDSKKEELFIVPQKENKTSDKKSSGFVATGMANAAETRSNNDALKYETTGSDFVDQFGSMSTYKNPRSYAAIAQDMSKLWAISPVLTIQFVLFIRTITRVTQLFTGARTNAPQRGAGLRHESILRMMWLHVNHKDSFWKNITLFITVGSWKDIITMLSYDLQFNGWDDKLLDWKQFGTLLMTGLENPNTSELVKKYLPQIKAKKKCTTIGSQADTMIGKWICSLLFGEKKGSGTYKAYRKLKSGGTAHQWQQLISQGKMLEIDFKTVHGRALAQMVSGKFLENQNLTKTYEAWIESQPIAKFTGFPHELFKPYLSKTGYGTNLNGLTCKPYQRHTVNKQFDGLVATAKEGALTHSSLIVVRDTSSSMSSEAVGVGMSSYAVAKALALFFAKMLPDGPFANSWMEFADGAKMHQWKGSTPYEQWNNDNTDEYGSTNFQAVIDLLIAIKAKGVIETEFPSGILCISDGEFNSTDTGETNFDRALQKLRSAGFSEDYVNNFKIVLWDIPNRFYGHSGGNTTFETHGDVKNCFYFSGYDPSIISFLTGTVGKEGEEQPSTAEELFKAAMDQEVLSMVQI